MSGSVQLQTPVGGLERPVIKPLDEAVWQAWVAKGRAGEQRRSAARMKAAKFVTIAGLLVAAGLWSRVTPYEVVVRFVVAAAALVVMFAAFNTKQYLIAAVSDPCAALQSVGARVDFVRRLASSFSSGKRRPLCRITWLAHLKDRTQ
jgi:hypothetical protein